MIIKTFQTEQDWLDARRGKITGTRLKDLIVKRGTKPKIGYYELIAEKIAIPASEENAMDRGHRLEEDAIERFKKETGKDVNTDLVLWCREDNENIAVSPDGYIGETEACEVKCLASARHLEAWLTKEIPSEYEAQVIQYFIVNDKLKKLYFIFYDPRMPVIDFIYYVVERKNIQEKVNEYLKLEQDILEQIKKIEHDIILI